MLSLLVLLDLAAVLDAVQLPADLLVDDGSQEREERDGGPVDIDDASRRLEREEFRALAKSLAEVRYASAIELLATYAGRATDLKPWLNEAEINRDRNLRLQYTAGTELNLDQGLRIYGEIIRFRNFPGELFSGTQALIEELRQAIIKRK